MTIRARLGALITLLLSAIVLASSSALFVSERGHLVRERRAAREAMVDQFVRTCRDARLVGDDLAAVGAASSLARAPGVLEAYAVDGRGLLFAHSEPGRVGQAYREGSDGAVRISRSLGLSDDPGAQAGALFSEAVLDREVRAALRPVARRILTVTLAALALGMLGAVLLARGITRPLLLIAEGTHAVAQGKLDHRLNFRRRDELGGLAEDFDRMAARLGELDKLKSDFVANVTHELRSPLSAIESYANLIAEEARRGAGADIVDHAAVVRNNATRLGRFINDLLDLAKIEARAVAVEKEALEAGEVLRDVAALFLPRAREKSIALDVVEGTSPLTVWGEPDKMRQMLTNLVGNALKFTPPGGRVTLSARPEGEGVRLSVADTGPGIAEKDQGRVFDRFEQVRDARDAAPGPKGTGLGLAIVRGLAEAHGGRVELESVPGRGSVFSLILPGEPA